MIGPTRLYGYTAQIEHARPTDEMQYIDAVRHRFYSGLLDMPVPISKYNFEVYGASTTPTLCCSIARGKWLGTTRGRCHMANCAVRLKEW